MNADEQGYQGWKNYETWATALWIDSEQALYSAACEMATVQAETAGKDPHTVSGMWTEQETARYQLADELKEWVEESLLPDLDASLAADLLNAAVSEIDWSEIADYYLDR